MQKIILILFILFTVSITWAANLNTVQVGTCQVKDEKFSVFIEKGKVASEGQMLSMISDRKGKESGDYLTTMGKLNLQDQNIRISPYWDSPIIPLSNCQLTQTKMTSDWNEVQMSIQGYFVSVWPIEEPIEELIKKGEAIPVRLNIICRTKEASPESPFKCDEVVFLDKLIPINHPPQPTPQDEAVQVQSRFCNSQQSIVTSGTSILWKNKNYVLTSAYSVLSGKSEICHRVIIANQGLKAKVVRQNFKMGLALLEVQGTLLKSVEIKPAPKNWPMKVELKQFSVDSNKVESQQVSVVSDDSSRHFIPGINRVIEIKGQSFPAKVVGAGIFNTSEFIGMVSHEHLKIFPGSLTRPQRWNFFKPEVGNHLLVISSIDILNWLNSSDDNDKTMHLSAASMTGEILDFSSGLLSFKENCPPFEGSIPHEDYPIGGGDLYGIGGDSNNYRACKIQVSLAAEPTEKFLNLKLQVWHDQLVSVLKDNPHAKIEIIYQIYRIANGKLERNYIYSGEDFAKLLNNDETTETTDFIYLVSGANADQALVSLRENSHLAATQAKNIYVNFNSSDPIPGEILRQTYLVAKMLQSEQWKMVKDSDFDNLVRPQGKYAKAWSFLLEYIVYSKALKIQIDKMYIEWKKL